MGFGVRNPPRSHAFAAAFEPRTAFATFSPSKSWRIGLHFEEYFPFPPKISNTQPNIKYFSSFRFRKEGV